MFNACVKSALTLVDDMLTSCFSKETLGGFNRYFASVSKICNVWREKAKEMCDSWEQLHEESTSLEEQKLGRRYPLAVIAGRWGSIEAAEDYLLLRGRTAVTRAMLSVLSRHMKSDRGSPISTTGENVYS